MSSLLSNLIWLESHYGRLSYVPRPQAMSGDHLSRIVSRHHPHGRLNDEGNALRRDPNIDGK